MRHFSGGAFFYDHLSIHHTPFYCPLLLFLYYPFIVILNEVKNLNAPTSALQILRFAQDDTMGVWHELDGECWHDHKGDVMTRHRDGTTRQQRLQQIKAPF